MQLDNQRRLQGWSCFTALIGITCLLCDFAAARAQTGHNPDVPDLGATARQAVPRDLSKSRFHRN